MKDELAASDISQLRRLEATIQAGKNTFVSVGLALTEIRDKRLYRKDHKTFEDYCEKRWGWSASRARQLIGAAIVVQSLPSKSVTKVTHERTARELSKVEPERRVAVLQKAVSTGRPISALSIARAAQPDIELDETGFAIPKKLNELWNRRQEYQDMMTPISRMIASLKAVDDKDPLWSGVHIQEILILLDKAYATLSLHKPYAVCVVCQGHPEIQPSGQCRGCKGRGFIGRYMWNNLDAKLKAVREKACKK